jgi:hypothetical protein
MACLVCEDLTTGLQTGHEAKKVIEPRSQTRQVIQRVEIGLLVGCWWNLVNGSFSWWILSSVCSASASSLV